MDYDSTYPLSEPRRSKTSTEFKIGLIADLDRASKGMNMFAFFSVKRSSNKCPHISASVEGEGGGTRWKSLMMRGTLTYNPIKKEVDIDLGKSKEGLTLFSQYSRGGRGMELSELVVFNGMLHTVDDRTGIVYKIFDEKAIPWAILPDGNGKQDQGFKGEWMCVKDEQLYVGGHGKEFLTRDGSKIAHKNFMWVKIITKEGSITHENWENNFNALRKAAGCAFPGYLTHESGVWSKHHKKWFFLPRKVSSEPYDYKKDQCRAGNLLLRCSEDFSNVEVIKIGELKHESRGYSTMKFIPGTDDQVIVALKSEEFGDDQSSFLSAFTIDGEVLLEDMEFSKTMKFEGIEFI